MGSQAARTRADAYGAILRAATMLALLVLGACNWSSNTDTPHYGLGGTVNGLVGSGLVLTDKGTTLAVNSGATSFSFGGILQNGDTYAVSVQSSPAGLTCSVASGTGTAGTADVNNVVVTCSTHAYTLGGTVAGLNGSGLVLANGTDTVAVPANAVSFTLPTKVAYTSGYAVTVVQQPTGLSCGVSNGIGTIPAANVTSVLVTCSDKPYSLGGTIRGLTGSGLKLANGADTLNVPMGATSFVMPTKVPYTSSYAVIVTATPIGMTCNVISGSGFMPAADVTNISVVCSNLAYPISGTVSGLNGPGLTLVNGADSVAVPINATSFMLPPVAYTSPYAVTVANNPPPPGLTCTVSNGSGIMPAAPVTNVSVTCSDIAYTLGGTITGLSASNLVLTDGSQDVTVSANAAMFSFLQPVAYTSPYTVSVKTQPVGELCDVTNATGVMPPGPNIDKVQVSCVAQPFTVGGTVSGLAVGASVYLLDNGTDPWQVSVNGAFAFPTKVLSGSAYAVTVETNPTNPPQTCLVTGGDSGTGSGTVQGADVTNVTVICATDTFNVGGTVTGLTGSGLVLQNNGGDDLSPPGNGTFHFGTKLPPGSPYAVTVKTQPSNPAQTCVLGNKAGTVTSADITNVTVSCTTDTHTIGGQLTGLGSGVFVVLQNNGADDLTLSKNFPPAFTFTTPVASGSSFAVSVQTQPTNGQDCQVTNGSGPVTGTDVTTVRVDCTPAAYLIGGTVSGLTGSGLVLQNNGGDNLLVAASDTTFQFPTSMTDGSGYAVTVLQNPSNGQTCTVTGGDAGVGAGAVSGANVTSVQVTCM